jgi:hypothetical protein
MLAISGSTSPVCLQEPVGVRRTHDLVPARPARIGIHRHGAQIREREGAGRAPPIILGFQTVPGASHHSPRAVAPQPEGRGDDPGMPVSRGTSVACPVHGLPDHVQHCPVNLFVTNGA